MVRKGTLVNVRFSFKVPCDAESDEQLREWICFQLHRGSCDNDNPLLDHDMDAIAAPQIEYRQATGED